MDVFETLKDHEIDALVKFKQDGKLDDETLHGLSDAALDAMVALRQAQGPQAQEDGSLTLSTPSAGSGTDVKERSAWNRVLGDKVYGAAKFAKDVIMGTGEDLAAKADDVVNIVSPVVIPISDSPKTLRSKTNEFMDSLGDEDDVSFETYKNIGTLSKTASGFHDMGLGEVKPEDLAAYNENLRNLLVNKMGYKDLLFDDEAGNYYVETGDGEHKQLNKDMLKTITAEVFGDKAEILAAMVGAKKGYDLGKPFGWKGKAAGALVGGAGGAALGNIADQLAGAIETGEKLTMSQRLDEIGKSAVLDTAGAVVGGAVIKGVVAGAKGTYKATKYMTDMIDMAKKFDVQDYAQKKIIDDMAKLPEVEQERYLDALEFAKENNIRLTSTSVLDHPQIDQLVQVLARNPFIRQGVKNLEAKSRDKLIAQVFDVLESAGPKATAEELDPLLKQELGEALKVRSKAVRSAYDEFENKVSGEVVTTAKSLLDGIKGLGGKYGFMEEGGKILDEEVSAAEAYVNSLVKSRADNKTLDAKVLDKISSYLFRKGSSYKVANPKLHSFYSEVKGLVDDEIALVSKYEGDEVAQALAKARKSYREKVGIYGSKSEYSEIRKAMESDRPNEAISALLGGEKGVDNANLLNRELSATPGGKALLGALGRKHIDDVFEAVDMKSPTALGRALSSDKMKVAKRLLGEASRKKIDEISTLLEMMGRTEKLLAGAGSEIASATHAPLTTRMYNGLNKMFVRLQQKRLFGKVFDNTLAQDLLLKTLRAADNAKTPAQAKRASDYLRKTARVLERDTGEDFSDIYDKKKVRAAIKEEVKAAEIEAESLIKEIDAFETPNIAELKAVGKIANNDDVVLLNQSIRQIQEGKATPVDVERYLKARNSIDADDMAKGLEKERVIQLPAKYRKEDLGESLANMARLRDYLMSNPDLKYGNEFSPQSVNALMDDLEKQGFPRSMKHDALYDDMKAMYQELRPRIDEAYGNPAIKELEEALDANGNSVFIKGVDHLLAGGVAGVEVDEQGNITLDPEKFILGMGGYAAAKAALKNPRVQKEMKDLLEFGLERLEKRAESGDVYAQSLLGRKYMFVGANAGDSGAFSNIYDKGLRKWLDDSKLKIKGVLKGEDVNIGGSVARGYSAKLGDLIEHDALFEQYPQFKNITVSDTSGSSNYNSFDGGWISLSRDKYANTLKKTDAGDYALTKKGRMVILHELQHAVQDHEKWARGGNAGMFKEIDNPNFYPEHAALKREYKALTDDASYREDIAGFNTVWKEKFKPLFNALDTKVDSHKIGMDEWGLEVDRINVLENEAKKSFPTLYKADVLFEQIKNIPNEKLSKRAQYMMLAGEQEARAAEAALKYPDMEPYQALKKVEGKLDEPIIRLEDGTSEMFVGRGAEGADLSKLDEAKKILKERDGLPFWKKDNISDIEATRTKTGWFRDKDGDWRFEIDDSKSHLNDNFLDDLAANNHENRAYWIEDLIQHDTLFENYPELRKMDVVFEDLSSQGARGIAFPDHIRLENKLSKKEVKSVLLHELQHQVQGKEGFARGGDSSLQQRNYLMSKIRQDINKLELKPSERNMRESIVNDMQIVNKQIDIDRLVDTAHKERPGTPYRNFYTRSDWHEYSREAHAVFGLPPKRAGHQRDEWVRDVAMMMANHRRKSLSGIDKTRLMNLKEEKTPVLKNLYSRLMRKLDKQAKDTDLWAKGQKKAKLNDVKYSIENISDYEMYRRLLGETEARNVQTRIDMTPDQRAATPIYGKEGSADVDFGDTISYSRNKSVSMSDDVASYAKELEDVLISNGRVDMEAIESFAKPLSKPLSFKEFSALFGTAKKTTVKTPIGEAVIDVRSQYHKLRNWKENRSNLSGVIKSTLEDPLFIVNHAGAKKYYAPYKSEKGVVHIISVTEGKDGVEILKSSYKPFNEKNIRKLIEVPDEDLLYMRGRANSTKSVNHSHPKAEHSVSDGIIAEDVKNVKKDAK